MESKKEWLTARMKKPYITWREIVPSEDGFEYLGDEQIGVEDDKIILRMSSGREKAYPRNMLDAYITQDEEEKSRYPIEITDKESLETIEMAKVLEWYAEHAVRRYRNKMKEVFDKIYETYNVNPAKTSVMLDGVPPMIYYVGTFLPTIKDDYELDE